MKNFVVVLLIFMTQVTAQASEGLFGYLYTAETTPGGNWEYEQTQTYRSGKARGQYDAVDLRNEFEFGITDRLQGALYLNSSYIKSSNQYDPEDVSQNLPDHNDFNVNGISFELMYRLLSPYKDAFGLALYIEPEISLRDRMTGEDANERALETRLILQKNFLDDELITAANLMLEPEWERADGLTNKELWAEITLGASYRLAPKWFAGVEVRNHMEFIEMNLKRQEHTAYFAGVNLHYAETKYWWTLTVLPQLFGSPSYLGTGADGYAVEDSSRQLGQHEKMEVRLRFGIPLGEEHVHVHD